MLLIDGVKYKEWTPEGENAEEELERMVKEHAQDIFGENSIYLDIKHKLKSKEGTGTIPDGYVITFGDNPQLHIVEIELSSHSYDHIISQITKIITCIKDSSTWNDIAKTIRHEIMKDEFIAIKAKKAIESGEVYEFLYDRISNLASLAIVIDKNREDVRAGIRNITHREIKMIEFQTFIREGAETVHAHLFEPLYHALLKEITKAERTKKQITTTYEKVKPVRIKDLIGADIIKSGQVIYGWHEGKKHEGKVLNGGKILIVHSGQIFDSLSGSASHIRGYQEDGWRWWRTTRENGKECTLAELREEYRAIHP